eukprot:Hpha_TRINITY_DN16730_c3_g3::TRINITY_DN16730_c3_g3_i8::g.79787::m.79787/K02947/RP-S10e, RPS10; small subunit ribosomal protein S10e
MNQVWLTLAAAAPTHLGKTAAMFIQSKNREAILQYLFKEGVIVAEKNMGKKHPELPVPNLEVIQLMRSFTSKQLVKQQYAWRHYYWYLTNDGINHLREILFLPADTVPNTLKKSARQMTEGAPRGADEGRRFQGGRGETRTDPADGQEKSKREFVNQYGGFAEWDAAGGRTGGGGGGRGPARDQETRPDPEDGVMRSKREFLDKYGGSYAEWDKARPRAPRAPGAWDEETALDAQSGETLTKRQFKERYGGFTEWDQAKKGGEGAAAPEPEGEQSW